MKIQAALFALAVIAAPSGALAMGDEFPEGPGKAELTTACSGCHGLDFLTGPRSREAWATVVGRMVTSYGAVVTDPQRKLIVEYLATHRGEAAGSAAAAPAAPAPAATAPAPTPAPAPTTR